MESSLLSAFTPLYPPERVILLFSFFISLFSSSSSLIMSSSCCALNLSSCHCCGAKSCETCDWFVDASSSSIKTFRCFEHKKRVGKCDGKGAKKGKVVGVVSSAEDKCWK